MQSPIDPILLRMADAVAISGFSRTKLYEEAAAGRLRMVKLGRATRVDYASLRALSNSLPSITLKHAA